METMRYRCIPEWKHLCNNLGIHIASDDATQILDTMEYQRKLQDRDTRHACAEACVLSASTDEAHNR